jgi:hypothetical protein
MESEKSKVNKMNGWFGLENTAKLTEEHLILCHTMYRSKIFAEYHNKLVLFDGIGKDEVGLA